MLGSSSRSGECVSDTFRSFRVLAVVVVFMGAAVLIFRDRSADEGAGTDAPLSNGATTTAGASDPRLEGRPDVTPEGTRAVDEPWPPRGMPAVGRVLGAGGTPIVGAVVTARVWGAWGAPASTGEDGSFAVTLLVGEVSKIVIEAPGYVTRVVEQRIREVEGATIDLGEFLLEPALRIAGRIRTEAGHPVHGGSVEIEPEAASGLPLWHFLCAKDEAYGSKETDADGRFVFAGLPPGRYRVLLYTEHAWYGDQVREHVEAGTEDVDFVVAESERLFDVKLKIRVVGPDDQPVPRAQVRLWGGDPSLGMTVYGKQDTELAIEGATDPVRLLVWDAHDDVGQPLGYAPVVIERVRTQGETLIVRMKPGYAVEGRVVWDGEPRVWQLEAYSYRSRDGTWGSRWEDSEDPIVGARADTDEEGRFRFGGLPRGAALIGLFMPGGPGRLKDGGARVEVPTTGVLLETVRTGTVKILVRAPSGSSLRSASVRVEQWVEGGAREVFGSQTSSGNDHPEFDFDAGGLEVGGRFRIVASGSCGGRHCGPIEIDDVRIRDEPYVVVLTPGARIRGRAVHPDGSPVIGAQVHSRLPPGGAFLPYEWNPSGLSARWATTDEKGAFAIDAPEGARYLLALYAPGRTFPVGAHPAMAGDTDVVLVAQPPSRITGRIHDDSGAPADGFRITGVPAEGVPVLWSPSRVAADGFFAAAVGPGRWRVSIWNERDEHDLRYALSDAIPAGTHDVRLTLEVGAALAGRVLAASGRPVPGARVWVMGPGVNRRARAGDDGRFLVHGIPPGRYEIFVRAPDGAEYALPAAVSEVGKPTELDLVLR